MRTMLIALIIAASCNAQENSRTGAPKPQFTDDTPQIVVEVRFITAPPKLFQELKSEDLIRSERPVEPQKLPTLTDDELAQQGGIKLVSATTVIERRQPVFIRSLTDQQTGQIVKACEGQERANILFAPKVTLFDQQEAMIADTTQRPFVVGLKEVESQYQPQIETLDDGIKMALRATAKGGDVRLDLSINMSEVESVLTKNAGPKGTQIQQPSMKATTVELSALVAEGKTLAISGLTIDQQVRQTQKMPYVGRLFRNTAMATESHEMVILITPRIVKN